MLINSLCFSNFHLPNLTPNFFDLFTLTCWSTLIYNHLVICLISRHQGGCQPSLPRSRVSIELFVKIYFRLYLTVVYMRGELALLGGISLLTTRDLA